ncbi:MAG: restriction endonuclease subunit S [Akkermansiaceae bacterium]|jgi:type I restriction enzyme S subunit|nr:restriction endonuclease subunit S [Akkermansiaceae bacterium]
MKLQTRPVSEIADQIRGVTYGKQDATKTAMSGYVPVLRAGNITDVGLTFDDLVYVPSSKVSPKQRIKKNDIVIAASSGSLDVVGKAARALEDFDGGFGAFCKVLRPRSVVNAAFFSHYFKTPEYRKLISSLAAGANINNLRNGDLDDLQIPLPPLAEQKRIAAILDAADALRTKRRESLAQLDALLQSTFLTLFGDPVENPMGWPRKSLGELAREKPNNGIFRKNPDYVQEGKSGLPVVWVEELFRGSTINTEESRRVIPEGTEIQKYGLKYGDVLFCRSSLKLDGIAFNNVYMGIDDEALFECHVIRISPDLTRVSPIYLNTLLRSPQMRAIAKSKSKTATMTTIDQKGLCSIEIPLPPLKLQQVFDNQFATVEKLKTLHRSHLAELDSLFAALQHRAFRGEL